MNEETSEKFPGFESIPTQPLAPENGQKKKEAKHPSLFTLVEGTMEFSGPYGGPYTQVLDRVKDDERLLVRPLVEKHQGGCCSFWVTVESPPEHKGERFWVAKLGKQSGFMGSRSSNKGKLL